MIFGTTTKNAIVKISKSFIKQPKKRCQKDDNLRRRKKLVFFLNFFLMQMLEVVGNNDEMHLNAIYCINCVPSSGQAILGGSSDYSRATYLASVELFPPPQNVSQCFIPNLPQQRAQHSLSLLSGGRLVICGGESASWSQTLVPCISWMAGQLEWTFFSNTRSSTY